MSSEDLREVERLLWRARENGRGIELSYTLRYAELRRRTLLLILAAIASHEVRVWRNLEWGGWIVWGLWVAALYTVWVLAVTRLYHLEARVDIHARIDRCRRACTHEETQT